MKSYGIDLITYKFPYRKKFFSQYVESVPNHFVYQSCYSLKEFCSMLTLSKRYYIRDRAFVNQIGFGYETNNLILHLRPVKPNFNNESLQGRGKFLKIVLVGEKNQLLSVFSNFMMSSFQILVLRV